MTFLRHPSLRPEPSAFNHGYGGWAVDDGEEQHGIDVIVGMLFLGNGTAAVPGSAKPGTRPLSLSLSLSSSVTGATEQI